MALTGGGDWPDDLGPKMRAALHEAATMVGQELVRRAQTGILTGPKSGRHYPGQPNQSSAPGEYAANQTGDLLNSINFKVEGDMLVFYSDSGHAGYLEYGTVKMAPRPNLEMAITESDGAIRNILEQIMWRAISGG